MKNKTLIIIFALLASFNLSANDKKDCESFAYNFKQCSFELPEMKDGSLKAIQYKKSKFNGVAVSKCIDGRHTIVKETCNFKPENISAGDCSGLPATKWSSTDSQCSHSQVFEVMKNGEEKVLYSQGPDKGYIKYFCENGVAQNIERNCGSDKAPSKKKKKVDLVGALDVAPVCAISTSVANSLSQGGGVYSMPSAESLEGMCESRCAFEGADYSDSFNGSNLIGSTFDLSCNCCTFTNQAPSPCSSSLNVISDDTALITQCGIPGDWDTRWMEYTQNPEGNLEKIRTQVCEMNGYSNLDNVVSSVQNGNLSDDFIVTANCSGNTNSPDADPCRGDFLGDQTDADLSGVPYNCEANLCWVELCPIDRVMPAELCSPCTAGNQTWADLDIVGNTCNANIPLIDSGESRIVPIENGSFNGSVAVSCNNGSLTVVDSQCYRNCDGGLLSWGDGLISHELLLDKTGLCSATLAGVDYDNDDLSPLLNTTDNTGDASFRCDGTTGIFNIESQECLLDCPSTIYFPVLHQTTDFDLATQPDLVTPSPRRKGWDAFADTGRDMACAFTMGAEQPHNTALTNQSDNDAFNNGSVNAVCNDGFWDIDYATTNCEVHCPAQLIQWGSGLSNDGRSKLNACSNFAGKTADNANSNLVSSLDHTGYGNFRCNDGGYSVNNQTCNLDCSATIPAQTFSGNGRTCSVAAKSASQVNHLFSETFRNEVGVNVGSVTMQCNDGQWQRTASSCAPKPCNATTGNWNNFGSCDASLPNGNENQNVTITDSNYTTGSAEFVCNNTNDASDTGTWQLSGSATTCFRGCASGTESWSNADTCIANISTGVHNQNINITDSTYPTRPSTTGGGTGSATYTCNGTVGSGNNGDFQLQSSTCNTCRDDNGSWGGWSDCNPLGNCGNPDSSFSTVNASCVEERFFNETVTTLGCGANTLPADNTRDTRIDSTSSCTLNCLGSWGAYTLNAGTCNGTSATETRTFNVSRPAANGGNACIASNGQTQTQSIPCNNCQGTFSRTSTGACDGSSRNYTETFSITQSATNGGASCAYNNGDTRVLSEGCGDCVGSWGRQSGSEGSCNGTTRSYNDIFTVTQAAVNGGASCVAGNGDTRVMSESCRNCQGTWIDDNYTNTCNGSTRAMRQIFSVSQTALNGGSACVTFNGNTRTVNRACTNCIGSFGSTYYGSCNGSTRPVYNNYTITQNSSANGVSCPYSNGFVSTGSQSCRNCVGSDVKTYTNVCNTSTGLRPFEVRYQITQTSLNGGSACPFLDNQFRSSGSDNDSGACVATPSIECNGIVNEDSTFDQNGCGDRTISAFYGSSGASYEYFFEDDAGCPSETSNPTETETFTGVKAGGGATIEYNGYRYFSGNSISSSSGPSSSFEEYDWCRELISGPPPPPPPPPPTGTWGPCVTTTSGCDVSSDVLSGSCSGVGSTRSCNTFAFSGGCEGSENTYFYGTQSCNP